MDPNDLNKNKTTSPSPAKNDLADLPPLPEAEDDTFSPPPTPPTPLPNESIPVDTTPEVSSEPTTVPAPTEIVDSKPDAIGKTDGDDKKPKKKSTGKIVGAVIALVLLVGVPMVALNIDKFRGDTRSSAYDGCQNLGDSCTANARPGRCRAVGRGGGLYCQVTITSAPTPTAEPSDSSSCDSCVDNCLNNYFGQPPSQALCNGICSSSCGWEGGGGGFGGTANPPTLTPTNTQTSTNTQTPCALGYFNNGTTCVQHNDGCINLGGSCTTSTGSGNCRLIGGPSSKLYCQITITSATPTSTPGTGGSDPTSTPGTGGIIECGTQTCSKDTQVCCLTGCKSIAEGCDGESNPTTAPPSTGGACVETRIYTLQDGVWKITALDQVGQFAGVGDKVKLMVRGDSSQFSVGRFRVNGSAWITTPNKHTTGEFYIEYTLSTAGTYNIEGQVQ